MEEIELNVRKRAITNTENCEECKNEEEERSIAIVDKKERKNNMIVERTTGSLLAVLDDKNRAIDLLKRQLHNQKIQLGYYLHKALSTPKIIHLSENCLPQITEDNIQLTLAMNKFYKQTGMKSRMMNLHDRMVHIDNRIFAMVERQEFLISKLIQRLLECSNTKGGDNVQVQFSRFFANCGQFEMFNDMLNATINLRKELDTFRICCNRLITIEDERNTLVEQVYSTPIEERMNCNYLIAVQLEKRRLEIEMEDIRNEQRELQQRVRTLNRNEDNIVITDDGNIDFQLHNMLEKVNSEAMSILSITEEQKEKFSLELSKAIEENNSLKGKLKVIENIIKEKNEMEKRVMQLENEYSIVIQELEERKNAELFNKEQEIEDLKLELKSVSEASECLNSKIEMLSEIKNELETLRAKYAQLRNVKKERDELNMQVENLEAVRNSYVEIVERISTENEMKCDYAELENERKKLREIEKRNQDLSSEITNLSNSILSQHKQIKYLLYIIEKLGKEKQDYSVCHTQIENNYKKVLIPASIPEDISEKSNNQQIMNNLPGHQEHTLKSNQSAGDSLFTKKQPRIFQERSKESQNSNFFQNGVGNHPVCQSSTSFEIYSTDKNGKVETMKGILECSAPVEGVIKMNNGSNLSLKIKCTPKQDQSVLEQTSVIIPKSNENIQQNSDEIDEYELMKDCSRESLIVPCPPCNSSYRDKYLQVPSSDSFNITHICRRETFNIFNPNSKELNSSSISSASVYCDPDQLKVTESGCLNIINNDSIPKNVTDQLNLTESECLNIINNDSIPKSITDQLNVTESECLKIINNDSIPENLTDQLNLTESECLNIINNDSIPKNVIEQPNVPECECLNIISNDSFPKNVISEVDVVNQLQEITSDLNNKLLEPGGRDSVLSTVKALYDSYFGGDGNESDT